jgi:RNA polymerase subunit RPABC4/transcription elongation factor Spt4
MNCPKCGQVNDQASNFCRFCGTGFMARPPVPRPMPFSTPPPLPFSPAPNYEESPPRPYAWKTDEFNTDQTKLLGSRPGPARAFGGTSPTQPDLNLQQYQPQQMAAGYHCPKCHSRLMPRRERRVSTGGWIVLGVLLLAFFPLFWIGFLIREDVSVCPVCNHKFTS